MCVCCITELVGENSVVHGPSQHHTPDAKGNEHKRLLARLWSGYVRLKDFDHRLRDFAIRRFDGLPAASDVGRQTDQRTRSVHVLQVMAR